MLLPLLELWYPKSRLKLRYFSLLPSRKVPTPVLPVSRYDTPENYRELFHFYPFLYQKNKVVRLLLPFPRFMQSLKNLLYFYFSYIPEVLTGPYLKPFGVWTMPCRYTRSYPEC